MIVILLAIVSIQTSGLPIGCINTSYSRTDEVEVTNDLGHLIVGAFAHHGPAFYENEVKRCKNVLAEDPTSFVARNDLAAAYTKLEEWDAAQAAFTKNEELHPGKYETASNLGVMYKKLGKFSEAESSIRRSLELKPGGHMRLGDYYLQMVQWRKDQAKMPNADASEDSSPDGDHVASELTKNFLGIPYASGAAATAEIANKEYVVTLIKNDMAFCDAYLVLGDILFEEGDYQLAIRAYYRAGDLCRLEASSAYESIAFERRSAVMNAWRANMEPGHVLEEPHHVDSQLGEEITDAAEWLANFQAVERELLEKGENVSFAALLSKVESQGIRKPRLLEAVYYEGTESRSWNDPTRIVIAVGIGIALFLFAIIGSVVGLVIFLRQRARQTLERSNPRTKGSSLE